jgi:hypothetical protein
VSTKKPAGLLAIEHFLHFLLEISLEVGADGRLAPQKTAAARANGGGGDQRIRQAGAVAGAVPSAPVPSALGRLAIEGQYLKGCHEGIQPLSFFAIANARLQLSDRDHGCGQGKFAALQKGHGQRVIAQIVDQHIGFDHE